MNKNPFEDKKPFDKVYFIKLFLCLAAIVVSIICLPKSDAAEINCYSGKSRIYHGFGNYVTFSDSVMSFLEFKSKHIILVTGQCVIMTRINQGERFYSVDLREGD